MTLKPFLTFIVDDYWEPIIKPTNPEEITMAEERIKPIRENRRVLFRKNGRPVVTITGSACKKGEPGAKLGQR